jgi:hypothetical protein
MSVYEPDDVIQFGDFIHENTSVAAVVSFGQLSSDGILRVLNSVLLSFPNVKCAKIEMVDMTDYFEANHIGVFDISSFICCVGGSGYNSLNS